MRWMLLIVVPLWLFTLASCSETEDTREKAAHEKLYKAPPVNDDWKKINKGF